MISIYYDRTIQWAIKWGHVFSKTNTKYELALLIERKIIVMRRRMLASLEFLTK